MKPPPTLRQTDRYNRTFKSLYRRRNTAITILKCYKSQHRRRRASHFWVLDVILRSREKHEPLPRCGKLVGDLKAECVFLSNSNSSNKESQEANAVYRSATMREEESERKFNFQKCSTFGCTATAADTVRNSTSTRTVVGVNSKIRLFLSTYTIIISHTGPRCRQCRGVLISPRPVSGSERRYRTIHADYEIHACTRRSRKSSSEFS